MKIGRVVFLVFALVGVTARVEEAKKDQITTTAVAQPHVSPDKTSYDYELVDGRWLIVREQTTIM